MDTTYIIDPSRAKQTISGYLTDLSENVIPKLEDEISTIESTLQDPSIARPGSEASNIFRGDKFATRPVLLPSEIASIRRHNDLKELLKKSRTNFLRQNRMYENIEVKSSYFQKLYLYKIMKRKRYQSLVLTK